MLRNDELMRLGQRGLSVPIKPDDAQRLLAEVFRLRRWLTYAAENMTYPYVQEDLERALSDQEPLDPPTD